MGEKLNTIFIIIEYIVKIENNIFIGVHSEKYICYTAIYARFERIY